MVTQSLQLSKVIELYIDLRSMHFIVYKLYLDFKENLQGSFLSTSEMCISGFFSFSFLKFRKKEIY